MTANEGTASDDRQVSFKYVYIPAETFQEIEERIFQCKKKDEVMGFLNHLKKHFKRADGPRTTKQINTLHQAFKAQMGDKAAGVDDRMLQMLSSTQMVETIALLANSPETGFIGVYMYCDDRASIKQLPANQRATSIARAAGMHIQVNGDVFIGRYMDNEEDFARMDFTAVDISSSAPWVAEANAQILRRSERSSDTQALLQRLQAPAGPSSSGRSNGSSRSSPADAEKAKGNEVGSSLRS
eukprot:GHRR01010409.1.p1 GENE.GHRR01010409.1~~GHRR01010409.1.p1  ORF type:complete len:241 (+),score=85.96 GHRR01010409.1:581-1303(+)